MPGMDGLDVCRSLRRESNTPIIMLTARVEESDKLVGLELGADDYITKPFSPRELVARVRVVLRRASGDPTSEIIRVGEVSLDRTRYEAALPEKTIVLTPTEFEILAALMSQPGRIFSRAQLLTAVHGIAFESYERAIDSPHSQPAPQTRNCHGEARYIVTVHAWGTSSSHKMAEASVRSIQVRLFLLLLRAFSVAVLFIVLVILTPSPIS